MPKTQCTLDPQKTAADWRVQSWAQRVTYCRSLLYQHGLLSERENQKVLRRIQSWLLCGKLDKQLPQGEEETR